MALSYFLRVACLIGSVLGLLQITIELLLWVGAPVVLRIVRSLPLRQRERTLYFIQLLPVFIALLLTALFFLPQYVVNETNLAPERVGWLCLFIAASLYMWWSVKIIRGIRMAIRTMLFSRACRLGAGCSSPASGETPIITLSSPAPRVALVGLLRPFIFISKSLTEEGGLDPLALQVVLSHERSHATHRDNWKLLALHCLPRLGLRLTNRKTWMQLWQSSAEWAADEDAVEGNSARALLLAETLVALARMPSAAGPQIACTYLVSQDTDLALRIEHLLHRTPDLSSAQVYKMNAILCLVAMGGAASLAALSSVLRYLPERLLHLG